MQQKRIALVIGRGHAGTRAVAMLVEGAGYSMGDTNGVYDYPADGEAYRAAQHPSRLARWLGGMKWDFSRVLSGQISHQWRVEMEAYLHRLYTAPGPQAAKLPELVLSYPWLARAYPEIRFVVVHREPTDNVHHSHGTDNIRSWGVPFSDDYDSEEHKRAASWSYQTEIVLATHRAFPNLRRVSFRLRDVVHRQAEVRLALGELLGSPVGEIPHRPEVLGRGRREAPQRAENVARYIDPALLRHFAPASTGGPLCSIFPSARSRERSA